MAICDESESIAFPLGTHLRKNLAADLKVISNYATQKQASKIIVGMPLTSSGSIGYQAKKTNIFIKALKKDILLPIETVDERYSSVEARSRISESGQHVYADKARIDAAAASIILQRYLDNLKIPK